MRQNTAAQFFALLCGVSLVLLVVFDAESRGRGGRGGGGFNRGGAAAGGSFGHQRGYGGSNRMNNNNGRMNDRADDRMDNRQDHYQDRRDHVDDYYDDRREWVEDRQAVRIGAYLTASAFGAMSCSPTIVVVGGVTYNQCGGDWYQRAYRSGSVTYIVVTAPAGY
jgi:hypothetical protein